MDTITENETLYVNNLNDRVSESKLKGELSSLVTKFGKCDVIVMSSLKRRGQAWIVYQSINESKHALESLRDVELHGKKLCIAFSRNLSDITRQRRGLSPRAVIVEDEATQLAKKPRKCQDGDTFFESRPTAPKHESSSNAYSPPNKILLVEQLSEPTDERELSRLFGKFAGFVEVRIIRGRGLAFVEFVDNHCSQVALNNLNGMSLPDGTRLRVSNSKT